MSKKKLYFEFSDNADHSRIVLQLSGAMAWIESDIENLKEGETDGLQYTLTPVWMTDEEFKKLPEHD